MTKKKIIIVSLILLYAICVMIFLGIKNKNKNDNINYNIDDFSNISIEEKVKNIMDNMTIEQKIAQMLVVYYSNDVIDDSLIESLKSNTFGGFILTQPNITTYEKTKKLVDELQFNSTIPLIISIDQEGGSVQRLNCLEDISPTNIPYMYDLGKMNDEKLAYQVGKVMAEELRTIGVNVVYAPVMDIYSNPENTVIGKRSFSENENIVAKMAVNLAKGLEDNGIIATYKHFPGHGDTSIDSHYSLPIIDKTYDDLKNLELTTFTEAVNNDAKIIMIGHIALPNVTGDNTPASLSKTIITNILKENMGYKGLVITDALNMGALIDNYSYEEIYVKAIEAGVDLLLMPDISKNAIEYIKNNISEERINESVKKILTFKYTYLNKKNTLDKSYLGSDEHKETISKIDK